MRRRESGFREGKTDLTETEEIWFPSATGLAAGYFGLFARFGFG
jgi:hypothetical protein